MIKLFEANVFGKIITDYNIYPDIAGRFEELNELTTQFPGKSISLGDMCDRGHQSKAVFDYFMRPENLALLGNHEHFMIDFYRQSNYYASGLHLALWLQNGGSYTLLSFCKNDDEILVIQKFVLEYANLYSNYENHITNREKTKEKLTEITNNFVLFVRKIIPESYILWLESLPLKIELESIILTHAPINPSINITLAEKIGLNSRSKEFGRSLIWNRGQVRPRDKIQFHGHNAYMYPKYFRLEEEIFAIGLDASKGQKLFVYVGKEDSLYYVEYKLLDYIRNMTLHLGEQ